MSRQHTTGSGRFAVVKVDGCMILHHVPTGLRCGSFSHIAVRTFKAAVAGVETAEANIGRFDLELIDAGPDSELAAEWPKGRAQALRRLRDALTAAFPNGAWS